LVVRNDILKRGGMRAPAGGGGGGRKREGRSPKQEAGLSIEDVGILLQSILQCREKLGLGPKKKENSTEESSEQRRATIRDTYWYVRIVNRSQPQYEGVQLLEGKKPRRTTKRSGKLTLRVEYKCEREPMNVGGNPISNRSVSRRGRMGGPEQTLQTRNLRLGMDITGGILHGRRTVGQGGGETKKKNRKSQSYSKARNTWAEIRVGGRQRDRGGKNGPEPQGG